jgi:predicted RNase H-like HicB family nuclease
MIPSPWFDSLLARLAGFRQHHCMNYRFSALITKQDDWYVARCPEFVVTSQGTDVESARANLREAIERRVETWGAPEVDITAQQPFWTFVEIAK